MLKQKRIRDEKYRRHIAQQPCLICENPDTQAAHISIGSFARGLKAGDDMCIPLCPAHHAMMDKNQQKFIYAHADCFGVDVVSIVKDVCKDSYREWAGIMERVL